jgi:hypothetical protein
MLLPTGPPRTAAEHTLTHVRFMTYKKNPDNNRHTLPLSRARAHTHPPEQVRPTVTGIPHPNNNEGYGVRNSRFLTSSASLNTHRSLPWALEMYSTTFRGASLAPRVANLGPIVSSPSGYRGDPKLMGSC